MLKLKTNASYSVEIFCEPPVKILGSKYSNTLCKAKVPVSAKIKIGGNAAFWIGTLSVTDLGKPTYVDIRSTLVNGYL